MRCKVDPTNVQAGITIRSYAGAGRQLGGLKNLGSHLLNGAGGRHIRVGSKEVGDVQVSLVQRSGTEFWVVVRKYMLNLFAYIGILCEIRWHDNQLGTKFLGL